jgi:hypothetical protein
LTGKPGPLPYRNNGMEKGSISWPLKSGGGRASKETGMLISRTLLDSRHFDGPETPRKPWPQRPIPPVEPEPVPEENDEGGEGGVSTDFE